MSAEWEAILLGRLDLRVPHRRPWRSLRLLTVITFLAIP
jgi:hypothetical protein